MDLPTKHRRRRPVCGPLHSPFSSLKPRYALFKLSLLLLLLLTLSSCSSAPKRKEPVKEISKAASEYAVFGNKFYRQGRYKEAEEMYLYSLEHYKRIDKRAGIIQSYNSLGKTYLATGRIDLASRLFDSAIRMVSDIEEEGSLPSEEVQLLKAESYNNIGENYLSRGEEEEALEYFSSGIEALADLDEPKELAILLHNRGSVYKSQGKYRRARSDLQQALEMNSREKRYREMASNHYMLCATASQENDFTAARSHGLEALKLDKKTENSVGIAQDLIALGRIASKQGKNEPAGSYYIRAYRIFDSLKLENEAEKCIEYLEEVGELARLEEEKIRNDPR